MDDKKLYQSFIEGNNDSFETIIKKYSNNLKYFIYKYVKDKEATEDIFQDTMVYLLTKKEIYNEKYSFKTFLYMVAKSRALNYVKKNNKTKLIKDETHYVEEKMIEDIIISKEKTKKIWSIIAGMNEEYQQIIFLGVIEELPYKEIAKIMDKTPSQIKNLLHRARVKLKKLLIEEKVVEIKNNKILKILVIFLVIGIISSGIVIAVKIHKGNVKMTPTYTSNISKADINKMWIGTFNLVWNDLMNDVIGGPVKFEEDSKMAEELNKQSFTERDISEKSYYKKHGYARWTLKEEIEKDLKQKFKESSKTLDTVEWGSDDGYVLYCMLKKEFNYIEKFPVLGYKKFKDSEAKVKYFGIKADTKQEAAKNIEILFYNSPQDFAIKLITKEGEEVYLYKNNGVGKSFEENYKEMNIKKEKYTGKKSWDEKDTLQIPFIKINDEINYDELCGKFIKGTDWYIRQAIQNVDFELNNVGGSVKSEALIEMRKSALLENGKQFIFDSDFLLFLKEENKEKPYFALKVDDTNILVEE